MKVVVAQHAGVCYGVERALRLAYEAAEAGGPVHSLGPLIHNPQAVDSLSAHGVLVAETVDDVAEGTLVIRTHGVAPEVIERARARGLDVVDATCPHVSKAQASARSLAEEGYRVVIVGEADHPEVTGIKAYAGAEALVVSSAAALPDDLRGRVGVVVQTTQLASVLDDVVARLLPTVSELRIYNTICSATTQRQQAAHELAGRVDVVLVVGGHNSGNTSRLTEICRAVNPRTHQVETAEEIDAAWFSGAASVGIAAGASTPDEQIRGVIEVLEQKEVADDNA